jgi:class 3 adenylate cyclase
MIPALSFRIKLLLAMLLLVVGVTGATLYVAQKKNQETFKEFFTKLFQEQTQAFTEKQEKVVEGIKQNCALLVRSPRVQFALQEAETGDSEQLYLVVKSELQTRARIPGLVVNTHADYATFYFFLNSRGMVIPPPDSFQELKALANQRNLPQRLNRVGHAITNVADQLVGFVTTESPSGALRLEQTVFARVVDTQTDEFLGALALGFPMPNLGKEEKGEHKFKAGILFENQIYSQAIPENLRTRLAQGIGERMKLPQASGQDLIETIGNERHGIFYEALNPDPRFPTSYLVALISMNKALESERDLRGRIFFFGGVGLMGALILSLLLSHGFSTPIKDLVKGTSEIQRGNFGVKVPVRSRDEIGRLAQSFNEMAGGLALKERYRSILDKVADKGVAEELVKGAVVLGGEQREISVLFCDIRGFTPLTQGMDPAEVIRMLNEHFTPLTRVVYEHKGIVDKFVGDLIMAFFGAPKSSGNDSLNAARCALDMLRERERLNETSQYKIKIGIGVASGPALAGNMGSSNRLNYTVLGERVNLASRLCGKAGRMEVVIDETTCQRLKEIAVTEPLPELELKGFSIRIQAYKLLQIHSPKTEL